MRRVVFALFNAALGLASVVWMRWILGIGQPRRDLAFLRPLARPVRAVVRPASRAYAHLTVWYAASTGWTEVRWQALRAHYRAGGFAGDRVADAPTNEAAPDHGE